MRPDIINIANRTIPPYKGKYEVIKPNGNTNDIIKEVRDNDALPGVQESLANFAPFLQGKTEMETLHNVWVFVKKNIPYKVDPNGSQIIKTPSATWSLAQKGIPSDCKSYSVFKANLLKNLGFTPFYRFAAYEPGDVSHVYTVVRSKQGGTIIIDSCMPGFNQEKPAFKKIDFMTKIIRVSGVGCPPKKAPVKRPVTAKKTVFKPVQRKGFTLANRDPLTLTEGEMELLISRDRLYTIKGILERVRGVGNIKAEKAQDGIDFLTDALDNIGDLDSIGEIIADHEAGRYHVADSLMGIGDIGSRKAKRKEKKAARQAKREEKKAVRQSSGGSKAKKFLTKVQVKAKAFNSKAVKLVKNAAQKTGKALTKVATAPAKLIVKAILEVSLPLAAPYFIYLFITDPAILGKLPAKVKSKRDNSAKIADFIVNNIGMKRPHFMGIVRNGVMKKLGKSPEAILSEMLKQKVSGIGMIPPQVITAAIPFVLEILKKLAGLFKKKAPVLSTADAPGTDDFAGANPELADELKALNPESDPEELDEDDSGGGRSSGWS